MARRLKEEESTHQRRNCKREESCAVAEWRQKRDENAKWKEECKKIAFNQRDDIRKKEKAEIAQNQRKVRKEMREEQRFADMHAKLEAATEKSLTETCDAQIRYKKNQKKKELLETKAREREAMLKWEKANALNENENRRQKQVRKTGLCEKPLKPIVKKQSEFNQGLEEQSSTQGETCQYVCEPWEDVYSSLASELQESEKAKPLEKRGKAVYHQFQDIWMKENLGKSLKKENQQQEFAKKKYAAKERENRVDTGKTFRDTVEAKMEKQKSVQDQTCQGVSVPKESFTTKTAFLLQDYDKAKCREHRSNAVRNQLHDIWVKETFKQSPKKEELQSDTHGKVKSPEQQIKNEPEDNIYALRERIKRLEAKQRAEQEETKKRRQREREERDNAKAIALMEEIFELKRKIEERERKKAKIVLGRLLPGPDEKAELEHQQRRERKISQFEEIQALREFHKKLAEKRKRKRQLMLQVYEQSINPSIDVIKGSSKHPPASLPPLMEDMGYPPSRQSEEGSHASKSPTTLKLPPI